MYGKALLNVSLTIKMEIFRRIGGNKNSPKKVKVSSGEDETGNIRTGAWVFLGGVLTSSKGALQVNPNMRSNLPPFFGGLKGIKGPRLRISIGAVSFVGVTAVLG